MRTPTIHLGGTPAARLMEQYAAARTAVLEAIRLVREVDVNLRDYPDPYDGREAIRDHGLRVGKLESVEEDLLAIMVAIDEQSGVGV